MGVEGQNIALAGASACFMAKKKPMSRASTFLMGEKTQNSFPEFLAQAHIPALLDASLMRVRPQYVPSACVVRASTCPDSGQGCFSK